MDVVVIDQDAAPPRDVLESSYDAFIDAHPDTLIYHTGAYRRFLLALLGCQERTLVAVEHERVHGVMPLMSMEHGARRVLNSLPFFGSHGGIMADTGATAAALLDAYRRLVDDDATSAATVVGSPFGADSVAYPANHHDVRISQMTDLPAGADPRPDLMARFEPSARRNIKKATRAGITVDEDPSAMDALRRMHQANMDAKGGQAKSGAFFRLVAEHFTPGRDLALHVARRDGRVVAGLLTLRYKDTVEYFVPAIDHAHRGDQPLAAILIAAMTESAQRGFRRWNWGGTWSGQTTLHRFKRKWGARDGTYRYATQLNDESLLDCSADTLLAMFPSFYVLPFSALRDGAGSDAPPPPQPPTQVKPSPTK